MKHKYILTAMALTSILLAGCDSSECNEGEFKADCKDGNISKCVDGKWKQATCDNDFSCNEENQCGDCKNDEVKADCANGKYSKCVNGKWTQTACDNDFSCNAENQCGQCKDGDEKDCSEGKVSRCINGKYQEVDCENNASCTTDGKCGECKNGDTTQCTNDSERVGSAKVCKDGKWSANKEACQGMNSCSVSDECDKCYNKDCYNNFVCNDDCKDTTCKVACDNLAICLKQCDDNNNGCESKCGECMNENHINCEENDDGVGIADICSNGKFKRRDCETIQGIPVSCEKKCTGDYCDDICGECKNDVELICVTKFDSRFIKWYEDGFSYDFQLVKCEEGKLWLYDTDKGYRSCDPVDCSNSEGRAACMAN